MFPPDGALGAFGPPTRWHGFRNSWTRRRRTIRDGRVAGAPQQDDPKNATGTPPPASSAPPSAICASATTTTPACVPHGTGGTVRSTSSGGAGDPRLWWPRHADARLEANRELSIPPRPRALHLARRERYDTAAGRGLARRTPEQRLRVLKALYDAGWMRYRLAGPRRARGPDILRAIVGEESSGAK